MMENDEIMCPLIDDTIEIGDCVVCSDVSSGMLKENCIPDKFKDKKNWKDICKNCKYHEM
jgi:hypothetical protein